MGMRTASSIDAGIPFLWVVIISLSHSAKNWGSWTDTDQQSRLKVKCIWKCQLLSKAIAGSCAKSTTGLSSILYVSAACIPPLRDCAFLLCNFEGEGKLFYLGHILVTGSCGVRYDVRDRHRHLLYIAQPLDGYGLQFATDIEASGSSFWFLVQPV